MPAPLERHPSSGLSGIALRVFNQPHAITQHKLDVIVSRVVIPHLAAGTIEAIQFDQEKSAHKRYNVTPEGIAVIDVGGTLVRRSGWLDAASGLCSYESLARQLDAAMEDEAVKGILWLCDSPGGEVAALFDFVDRIYGMRGRKPMYAAVSEMACSACYAIASAADRIFLTRTSAVGSIGIVVCHADTSSFDGNVGVKYTYIYEGDRKIDGNPHEPLSKEARKIYKDEVGRCYGLLVATVARNRKLTQKAVRETQAAVYFGDNGIAAGLADQMGTPDEAVAALVEQIANNEQSELTEDGMPAIPPHKTATTDAAWNGPENKKRLRSGESQAYYESAYAYRDEDGDPETKSAYDFIHHMVAQNGDIGAANVKACESGIGVLNGARGGTKLEGPDRKGVYRHLAKHIRDAGGEPPELSSEAQVAAQLAVAQVSEAGAPAPSSTKGEVMSRITTAAGAKPAAMGKKKTGDAKPSTGKARKAAEADDDEIDAESEEADEAEDAEEAEEADDAEEAEEAEEEEAEKEKGKKGKREKAKKPQAALVRKAGVPDAAAAQIADLCILAGRPAMAATLIKQGVTVAEAMKQLQAARAAGSAEGTEQDVMAETGTSPRVPPGESGVVKKCKAIAAAQALARKGA